MKLFFGLLLSIESPVAFALLHPAPRFHQRTLTILDNRKRSRSRRRRRISRGPKHFYEGLEPSEDDDDTFDAYCPIYTDLPIDHAGLSKSIDDEYAAEEAKIDLTFWQILERERKRVPSEFSSHMTPYQRASRRMDFKKGNIESKYELMTVRDYGNAELLDKDHLNDPPTLDDLNRTPASFKSTYWSQPLFRVGVVATAYFTFPYWCKLFINFQTIDPKKFNTVVNQLGPNVGVLYATILALTLGVLYNRFTRIQENVTTEASILTGLTRNILSLFQNEPQWATDACQMIANQLRILLSRTRGVELLSIMKADTYSNILALVDDYHYVHGCDDDFSPAQESTLGNIRADLTHIMEVRALRLSDEASSLPPTHFLLLTSLSAVSSIAYVTASLAVIEDLNDPPQEARLLFAGLAALYVLFFNFCKDLNGPFQGVYQIKRSNAVSHLLQTKWLIVNQLGDSINFREFDGNSPPKRDEDEVQRSPLDRIKQFFLGSNEGPEEITDLEADTMATLVKELANHNQVKSSSSSSAIEHSLAADDVMTKQSMSSEMSAVSNESLANSISSGIETKEVSVLETYEDAVYPPKEEVDELCDTAETFAVSLDCNYDSTEEGKSVTVSSIPGVGTLVSTIAESEQGKSGQFDYASYFRNTGGFSK